MITQLQFKVVTGDNGNVYLEVTREGNREGNNSPYTYLDSGSQTLRIRIRNVEKAVQLGLWLEEDKLPPKPVGPLTSRSKANMIRELDKIEQDVRSQKAGYYESVVNDLPVELL